MLPRKDESLENKNLWLTGFIGVIISYMFDTVGVAVSVLVFFMLADYVTGILAAIVTKQLHSRIGLHGFLRKAYVLIAIGSIYALEFVAAYYTEMDILGGHIGDGAAFAFIVVELISITENGTKMNVPMPPYVKNLLKIVKDKTGMTEDELKQQELSKGTKEGNV